MRLWLGLHPTLASRARGIKAPCIPVACDQVTMSASSYRQFLFSIASDERHNTPMLRVNVCLRKPSPNILHASAGVCKCQLSSLAAAIAALAYTGARISSSSHCGTKYNEQICTPKEWELDPKATLLDLATGTLLSALLGPLLDGQGDILGSLGTPQQQRSSATCRHHMMTISSGDALPAYATPVPHIWTG